MPSLANLFVTPDAQVLVHTDGEGAPITSVRVDGLMCNSLCVRRVKRGLQSLSGISEVSFNPATDTFQLNSMSALPDEYSVRNAVLRQVVFPGLRRLLGSLRRLS